VEWLKKKLKLFSADTLALEISGILPTIIKHLFLERWLLNFTLIQQGIMIPLYFVLRLSSGRLGGKLKDDLERRWFGENPTFSQKWIAGSVSLATLQIPIYTFCAVLAGIGLEQLMVMWGWFFFMNAISGGWYSFWLSLVRKWFFRDEVKVTYAPKE